MVFEDELYIGDFRQFDIFLVDFEEEHFELADDLVAPFEGVGVGAMESVGHCVNELHKAVFCQIGNNLVGVLLGDMNRVEVHFRGSEHRHPDLLINI